MKNTTKVMLFLTSVALSSSVNAAPYLSGQVGIAGSKFNSDFLKGKYINRGTGRVAVGFLVPTHEPLQLGLEAGAQAFKSQHLTDIKGVGHRRRTTFDILGVVDVFASPYFDLYAKGGFAYVHQSTSVGGEKFKIKHAKHAVVPEGALGMGLNLPPNFNVNLSVTKQFGRSDNTQNKAPEATSLLLGVKYTFA